MVSRRLKFFSSAAELRSLAPCRGQAGITILEVVVAALIVGIAGVGVAMMFSAGQALVASEGLNRTALQLAQQRLEQIRSAGFGTPTLPDPREETAWTAIPDHPGFERTTVITGVCSRDYATAWAPNACASDPDPEVIELAAKRIVVTVRALSGGTSQQDPQTTPQVVQAILVRR
jgi:type II secretory pathway pseudopilin PulG